MLCLLTNGAQHLDNGIADGGLERTVAETVKFFLNFVKALARDGGINVHEVGNAGLVLGVKAHAVLGVGVGDGTLKLACDILGLFQEEHAAVGVGLAHLRGGVAKTHDPCAHLGDVRLGNFEGLAVEVVKAGGDIPCQLAVLALILTDGNEIRLIKQDVRRHESGVGEQAAVNVVGVLCALVLKLRHAA